MELDELPDGWTVKPLSDCVAPKEHWSLTRNPRQHIRYVELAGIDNERGVIESSSDIVAAKAPSRAKKVIRAGDVIFATTRPNLKNIAIVPPELNDEICSTGFCVLRPKIDVATSGWIFGIVRSDWFINQVVRHDEKNAYPSVNDDEVLAVEIPVPPLVEQRRIAARVEALTSRSQQLRELNTSLVEDMTRLLRAEFSRITKNAPTKQFSDVAKLVRRWVKTTPDQNYPETGIRSFGKGTFHKPALTGRQIGSKRICRIKEGDLVFMNVFAWEGAIAVAQPEDDGRVASYRFMTHEVLPDQATADFLCYYFLTEHGLEKIRGASPGSAGRNRTLGITKLEKIPVPVPPIEDQRRFAKLRKLQFQLQRLQREAKAELASFTPALLAKAFRGEL
jgi:type I restriction enzyme, S subunit